MRMSARPVQLRPSGPGAGVEPEYHVPMARSRAVMLPLSGQLKMRSVVVFTCDAQYIVGVLPLMPIAKRAEPKRRFDAVPPSLLT